MKVFDGHSTVRPRTSKNSNAARAAPVQLEVATAGSPFHAAHASSNARVRGPSVQSSALSASSQSACRRSRSRWSNPIANSFDVEGILSRSGDGRRHSTAVRRAGGAANHITLGEHESTRNDDGRGTV